MSLMARLGGRGNRKVPFALFDGKQALPLSGAGEAASAYQNDAQWDAPNTGGTNPASTQGVQFQAAETGAPDRYALLGTGIGIKKPGTYIVRSEMYFGSPGDALAIRTQVSLGDNPDGVSNHLRNSWGGGDTVYDDVCNPAVGVSQAAIDESDDGYILVSVSIGHNKRDGSNNPLTLFVYPLLSVVCLSPVEPPTYEYEAPYYLEF